jgi:hypothetical protein
MKRPEPGHHVPDETIAQPIAELQALPQLSPPPALWSAVCDQMDRQALARRSRHRGWMVSGLAAALALAVGIGVFNSPSMPPSALETASSTPASTELIQVRQLSALLEASLRQQQVGAVSTGALESLVYLENELGWLDIRLASRPGDLELWQRRIELLDEMNRLYGRNHWQTQMKLTSL